MMKEQTIYAVLGRKHVMDILEMLGNNSYRFSTLMAASGISAKVLIDILQSLMFHKIVKKRTYHRPGLKRICTSYSITPRGVVVLRSCHVILSQTHGDAK